LARWLELLILIDLFTTNVQQGQRPSCTVAPSGTKESAPHTLQENPLRPLVTLTPRPQPLRTILIAAFTTVLTLSALPAGATIATGPLGTARMMHQANTLADGRVLFTGGYMTPGSAPYASTEIYDPTTGLFRSAAPMLQAREEHAAVRLLDGRVMVLGGSIATSPSLVGTASTEIFDPTTGQWSPAGNMSIARSRAMARLLPNGKVFVMNTDGYDSTSSRYAEVYDPQTGLFTKTGEVVMVTGWHGLVVLADGRVMKVGGYGNIGGGSNYYTNKVEIWDPATNLWSATASMAEARQDIRPVLLPDGKVLVAGGRNQSNLNSTEIYDPATATFSRGAVMPEYLPPTSATVLPNGDVILAGDYSKNLLRYQAATGQWNLTGPKRSAARSTSFSLLPNGSVLLAGGAALNDATPYAALWDLACAPQQIALQNKTQSVAASGGQVGFMVTVAAGCRFEATDLPNWVSLSTPSPLSSDTGSMPVSFTVAANNSGADRTATLPWATLPLPLHKPCLRFARACPSCRPIALVSASAATAARYKSARPPPAPGAPVSQAGLARPQT